MHGKQTDRHVDRILYRDKSSLQLKQEKKLTKQIIANNLLRHEQIDKDHDTITTMDTYTEENLRL